MDFWKATLSLVALGARTKLSRKILLQASMRCAQLSGRSVILTYGKFVAQHVFVGIVSSADLSEIVNSKPFSDVVSLADAAVVACWLGAMVQVCKRSIFCWLMQTHTFLSAPP